MLSSFYKNKWLSGRSAWQGYVTQEQPVYFPNPKCYVTQKQPVYFPNPKG